jgi:type-F conjugative transfer system protein TrbI
MKMTSLLLTFAIAFQLVLTAFTVFHNPSVGVVCFDKEKVTGEFIRQLAVHHASESQVKSRTLQFKNRLQTSLAAYSKKHAVVIVDTKSQLAGAADITDTIEHELSQAMRATS